MAFINQFASVLNRKDIVQARLNDARYNAPLPQLTRPPTVDIALATASAEKSGQRLQVRATTSTGLSRLRLFQDGQLIEDTPISGERHSGMMDVQYEPHARLISVLAVDTNGFVSSPQVLRLRPSAAGDNTLHAVLVGVDTYIDPTPSLTYGKSDAIRLSEALATTKVGYYGRQHVTLLVEQDATVASITSALEKAVIQAKPRDTILFSFAGHGLQAKNGKYYLTPSEFQLQDATRTGLSWTAIARMLERSKARVVVLLDACHSGLSGSQGLASNDAAATELLSGKRAPILVLAAAKGREFSFEDKRRGGGVFTYALFQILSRDREKFDKDADGTISVSELYRGLREIVTRETDGAQTPWLARQDLIGDFPLF
jgi:hypothetical protein